jgi:hypothetical protein
MIKQVYEIIEEEISKYKLWEFLSEDDDRAQDEATVISLSNNTKAPESIFITLAKFYAYDGSQYNGYIYGEPSDNFGLIQPVIIAGNKQIPFWSGIKKPERITIKDYYSILSTNKKMLFPIKWESQLKYDGFQNIGMIKGFGFYKSLINRKVGYKA